MALLRRVTCTLVFTLFLSASAFAQSGKISGTVTESETGNPLPGVNVVIEGTQQGATTNAEGFYTILNVSPGTYDVRASFVGFTPVTQEGVNVNIDLTTEVDFQMQEETVGLEEVTVQATEAVVKRDISANVANLSAESIENIPVASVEEVVGLQAGVEPGLRVRGGGQDQLAVNMDGFSMRAGRDNTPFTGISYTAVDEVQVQTGGFSAEYGNVRSGLINIVTKEGPRDHYTVDVLTRYSPSQKQHFGIAPNDPQGYFMRSYLDPAVAFEGTHSENSPWDVYQQSQYPRFEGWNSISEQYMSDENPNNDLTPDELIEVFNYYHRKDVSITEPNYEFDGSLGGPVPGVSDMLGDLRFFGSYRQTQTPYVLPQMRDVYRERMGQLKITSNVANNMKLTLQGLYATQQGINASGTGQTGMFQGEMPQYPWDGRGTLMANNISQDVIFATNVWNPMDVTRSMMGAELTHTLGSNVFYEASLQRVTTDYSTTAGRRRDTSVAQVFGDNYTVDEAPFGYTPVAANGPGGLRLSGHWGASRDSSEVAIWSGEFDVTSQLNQYLQLKAGLEYIFSNYDVLHGEWDPFFVSPANPKYDWSRSPRQGAFYVQNKLEFEGMVANLGVRADYFYPGGSYYSYGVYERAFSSRLGWRVLDDQLEKVPTQRQFALSPRLGVSFPITEVSKVFFNYGHFRSMLSPASLYAVERSYGNKITFVGNPNHPMPLTVAYELGYEQALLDQYLIRLSGYYRALSDQPRNTEYESLDGRVEYSMSLPNNYEDVRGLELTLTKNRGEWMRGFVNFTYMAHKSGNFGLPLYYENRSQQRQYERNTNAYYQSKPVPEPYARFNVEFLTPSEFGPEAGSLSPLGNWRLSLLGTWRAGQVFTWNGGGGEIVGLENNARWKDYHNLDLRLTKNVSTGVGDAQFFVDVSNVLNLKQMHRYSAFQGNNDFRNYMQSLHLPKDTFEDVEVAPYEFVPGDDRPGEFRAADTPFIPIEIVKSIDGIDQPASRALYYIPGTGGAEARYMWYRDDAWQEADAGYVDSVLEHKQYIDMPNLRSFTFLNPRRISLGLRIQL